MRGIDHELLRLFFNGLRFAPVRQKERELARAEDLLQIVRPDGEYPFDFVCYKITGFRPTGPDADVIIPGTELIRALNVFISWTNREVAPPLPAPDEAILTVDDLARRFGVSTKTIHRWRWRGLRGRLYVFDGGRKKLGFSRSAVERFVEENRELVEKAGQFKQLTRAEKERIVEQAVAMAERGVRSRHQIVMRLAAETGRSRETIRQLLAAYDHKAKDRSVFRRSTGRLRPRDVKALCKARSQGASIAELMEKFDRSRASVYRIINTRRAADLMEREITYVDSVEFTEPERVAAILAEEVQVGAGRDGRGVLTREQERALFRRCNCLKFEAKRLLSGLKASRLSNRVLRRIEEYLEEADRIKRTIIESNLRLVANVAQKHQGIGALRADLISEGNFSLMRAVEKFDYSRGYRFSTYASWAIAKDFAKRIPEEAHRPDKSGVGDVADLQDLRREEAVDFAAVERAHRSLEEVISENLTEREQFVVRNHFALEAGPVKRKPRTLRQIGEALGLSSERVRQIELAALQKLRQNLSPEEFDLLTG
ncbi:MAG TPA: sigma-70 family RNA polymerase sigma factor [Anaerohalosphaeraceae bacterium]|nr:sigma-70 family RNA polymerase sigma factor [Anaerohalosphaeraceae bacterium]HRT51517.1 sigma-70 family RNA polymerase sigma factor [Anaerohalosphaeraceae bacterium]HRT87555.1 sigma-70 family RNA polymerase sigma factor [Anaerohalosphaeraceae bacterium]